MRNCLRNRANVNDPLESFPGLGSPVVNDSHGETIFICDKAGMKIHSLCMLFSPGQNSHLKLDFYHLLSSWWEKQAQFMYFKSVFIADKNSLLVGVIYKWSCRAWMKRRYVIFPYVTIPNITFQNVTIPNIRNNPERTKLGEGKGKVRLSQDRMTILSFHLTYSEGKGLS